MAKILLVEDDKNLREIYSIRLTAEGYEVATAGDGEEALAVAVKERPNLILSDVMMPKISGFDMLDILRSTPETKEMKVIMMTALSSEDQRQRGESLGADRYLVKSQVGIEDVVNAIHEVLGDATSPIPSASPTAAQTPPPTTPVQPTPTLSSQPQSTTPQQPTIPQQPATPQQITPQPSTPLPNLQQPSPQFTPPTNATPIQ